MKKFHYVYRITNTKEHKHYIGAHSSNILPEYDLGVKYFTSSRDGDFIKDQKENGKDYIYQVLEFFDSRKEAIDREMYLHEIYAVDKNINFYNRKKQGSNKFDTSGYVLCEDVLGKNIMIKKEDPRYKTIYFPKRPSCIKETLPEEHKNKISKSLTGVKHSSERIESNRLAQLGRIPWNKDISKGSYSCPYCNVNGGLPFINEYHGEKCKHKIKEIK